MADYPLRSICALWNSKLELARQHKKRMFGDMAAEAMRFYSSSHYDWMYESDYARSSQGFSYHAGDGIDAPQLGFRMCLNKVAELVQLFGPLLYHKNPERVVRPRQRWVPPPSLMVGPPPDPMMAQLNPMADQRYQMAMQQYGQMVQQSDQGNDADLARAILLETYLNYTPNECGLRESMRAAIDEALIKGRGVAWTESWQPPGSQTRYISSYYDTVDRLLIDPDMETVKDALWISREMVVPVWKAEEIFQLKRGSLKEKGTTESINQTSVSDTEPDGDWARKQGRSNDLIRYSVIYSRMGLGAKLSGATPGLRDTLDRMGDNVYLVVAKNVPYPLNLPPELVQAVADSGNEQAAEQLLERLDWPIPFWRDNEWPMTELDFHPIPRRVWPMSHIQPAMGELKFLQWAYSFLAGKMKNTSRDFVAILKSASEEMKQAILNGKDLALLEIESQHKTISEVVQMLQFQPMNSDFFKVIQAVEHNFDKRTGLLEAVYGESERQWRSAEEANVKGQMTKIRPDDMAEKVEHFATRLARKEAIAARWMLTAEDVAPLLGQTAAQWWGRLVQSSDFETIVREMEYRIEAGSTRKPNKDRDVQNTTEGVQVLLPILSQWAAHTGNVDALNGFLQDWAKARDLDAKKYILPPPPPPMPMPPEGGPGSRPEMPAKPNGKPKQMTMMGV